MSPLFLLLLLLPPLRSLTKRRKNGPGDWEPREMIARCCGARSERTAERASAGAASRSATRQRSRDIIGGKAGTTTSTPSHIALCHKASKQWAGFSVSFFDAILIANSSRHLLGGPPMGHPATQ